jgi:acyl-CoA thioester hydrolase
MNPVVSGAVVNNDTVFRYPVDVRFFEVDSLGVVFNMWYLGWCDEAMSAFMESIGYGYATLRVQGFDAVLRNAQIEWADSLEAFQHAEIGVLVDHVGTTSFRLRYDIDRIETDRVGIDRVGIDRVEASDHGRTRCARVAITYVCVAVDGRSKVPIPADLREALVRHHT